MSSIDSSLILPGTIEYEETLSQIPFYWKQLAADYSGEFGFAANSESRLLEVRDFSGMVDYIWGGEYEELLIKCPWLREDYYDPDDWEDELADDRDGCSIIV
jgi:hypothetical protein